MIWLVGVGVCHMCVRDARARCEVVVPPYSCSFWIRCTRATPHCPQPTPQLTVTVSSRALKGSCSPIRALAAEMGCAGSKVPAVQATQAGIEVDDVDTGIEDDVQTALKLLDELYAISLRGEIPPVPVLGHAQRLPSGERGVSLSLIHI